MTNDPSFPALPPELPSKLPSELPSELVDELCSADLDGELVAACADHGIELAEARAVVDADSARRAALAAASSRVGELTPADQLDELERRRVSRVAVARATRQGSARDRRAVTVFGLAGAAAVLLVAVVVIALAHTSGDSSSKSAGTSPAAIAPVAGHGRGANTPPDLGAISNGRDLALHLGLTGRPNSHSLSANAADSAGQGLARTTGKPPSAPGAESSATTPVAQSTPAHSTLGRCLGSLPLATSATDVRVVATVRLNGAPVTVARGALGNTVVLWAFHPANCSVAVFYTGT